ncbi:hypothetical protein EVAR_16473_1 [Eumeta japonica]|uniref:Uncharacterized protein n=1 Tax=Eumeta variegata TaxID=151549 RepID=A0A4C1UKB5_EUMVA|nr:hypothetical protein EVAR_16473_1 [Eumeta japonica]
MEKRRGKKFWRLRIVCFCSELLSSSDFPAPPGALQRVVVAAVTALSDTDGLTLPLTSKATLLTSDPPPQSSSVARQSSCRSYCVHEKNELFLFFDDVYPGARGRRETRGAAPRGSPLATARACVSVVSRQLSRSYDERRSKFKIWIDTPVTSF